MKGKYVYYQSYASDIGHPSIRRRFFLCPACTTETAKLWKELSDG